MQEEQLAEETIVDNLFVNRLHLVPDVEMISGFLIRSGEYIVRMTSLYFSEKGNGAVTLSSSLLKR
jgi:hypothetical protein